MKTIFIIIFLIAFTGCSDEKNKKLIKVSGTVENTLLVSTNSWLGITVKLGYKTVTLLNGKKYRIPIDRIKGASKGFKVEITLAENSTPNNKGEYEADSIKLISIPIPGINKK